jgi:IS30 family transposase
LATVNKVTDTPERLLEQINEIKKRRKKRKLSSSRLNRHLDQIILLHYGMNASCADIALWLRANKRIRVSRQAVFNFIKKHMDSIEIEEGRVNT